MPAPEGEFTKKPAPCQLYGSNSKKHSGLDEGTIYGMKILCKASGSKCKLFPALSRQVVSAETTGFGVNQSNQRCSA
jgi:hypothetical protein